MKVVYNFFKFEVKNKKMGSKQSFYFGAKVQWNYALGINHAKNVTSRLNT